MNITSKQDTVLKKSQVLVDSSELPDDRKYAVPQGTKFKVLAKKQIAPGHTLVTLSESVQGFNTWLLYEPHWKGFKNTKLRKAKWFSQVDNSIAPHVTCNVSASASLVSVYKNIATDEALLNYVFNTMGYNASTDHNVVNQAIKGLYNLDCTFDYNMSFEQLESILNTGQPVVLGILHKGSKWSPYGGHMACAVKNLGGGRYQFCDPYGSLHDNYGGSVKNGDHVIYTRDDLVSRWTADGPGTGWGRYLTNWEYFA